MDDMMITSESEARALVRAMENAWNRRDLESAVLGHTVGCQWRCRAEFIWGREQLRAFVARRWRVEIDFRMAADVWSWDSHRISSRFAAEYRTDSGAWYRTYGNDNWVCDRSGAISLRLTSANEHQIEDHDRKLRWEGEGRPADFPSLLELGL